MATNTRESVGTALELLTSALRPFVEHEFTNVLGKYWLTTVTQSWRNEIDWADDDTPHLDASVLLRMMWDNWNNVFSKTLGQGERSLVSELRTARNNWAHQKPVTANDAARALDNCERLATAVGAPEAADIKAMRIELLREVYGEAERAAKKAARALVSAGNGSLTPWRDVVAPHDDVASGSYQTAEFAADLWQVHINEGLPEYANPVEFFKRTYMTASLRRLLATAAKRLTGGGGDPVVQLQTNFGGGKTHSMLALYHLASGRPIGSLMGVEEILLEAGVQKLPPVRRVVLVGNKLSPGNPAVKEDGTRVHTLWGELAYQLGGREAYDKIRQDDERGTSPGDRLRELMDEYGPSIILIDEWVAYARQLHDEADLPGGGFETQFSFAQALTESAKLAKSCLLVVSLPASDAANSSLAQSEEIEVGGERGREALERLRNVVGRVESSWRPASAEEGFEIVRRRLFQPLTSATQIATRDTIAAALMQYYRKNRNDFPAECNSGDYEERIKAAYPVHPEVFDRLYNDWSTLARFQRTRGVLRLMAAVIHSLWENQDRGALIMPSSIPLDDDLVRAELTRYLPDTWLPVIAKDIDGSNSLPVATDNAVPTLGRYNICRRTARTIYLGSAPVANAANVGLDDLHIRLGCVLPDEIPSLVGDALRRLAGAATYLYSADNRYWFSTQPTVTKIAEDKSEAYRRQPDQVLQEIERRVRANVQKLGDFAGVHPFPGSSADVPDSADARLVVIGCDKPHSKSGVSDAEAFATSILRNRGNAPRLNQNSLVFLAADRPKLTDLVEATCKYMAWNSIVNDDGLTKDLTGTQNQQAKRQRDNADNTVTAQLPEAFPWLLVPVQEHPKGTVEIKAYKLTSGDELAVRASKKMVADELLVTNLAPSLLKHELDRVPLWEGNDSKDVAVKMVVEYFARYIYLPRVKSHIVLAKAIQDGLSLLTWEQDGFAYADSYDAAEGRYRGLVAGRVMDFGSTIPPGLLVKAAVAAEQLNAEAAARQLPATSATAPATAIGYSASVSSAAPVVGAGALQPLVKQPPRRYHATVNLAVSRVGRDAGKVAEEVVSHLAGLLNAKLKVTLEIEAEIPSGVTDEIIRIVTQNGTDLNFTSQGFEE